jgi:hypothetical protein
MPSETLSNLFRERIANGLSRKTITSASKWACKYRIMGGNSYPGPWTFEHHPWLEAMHDSTAQENVGMKGAQVGFTETVLDIALYNMDIHAKDVLYVLPSKTPDASDFSAARFDTMLELSPYIARMFSNTKNVGHKKAGSVNFYLRGANSRGGLKSVPVGLVVLDELDEMNEDNVPLAWERTSGQLEKSIWKISTPTIKNEGIHAEYVLSSQNHYFFKCPCCSRFTELIFPDCLVITAEELIDPRVEDSHLICKECKGTLPHKGKSVFFRGSQWVEGYADRDIKGWHINQLYSPTVTPVEIAKKYLKARQDKSEEQEFWNSKMGVPHEVDGARLSDQDLKACEGEYLNGELRPAGVVTMGVDVGVWLHVEIDQWRPPSTGAAGADINMLCVPRVLKQLKVKHFEELDDLMWEWKVHFAVLDAQPERRKAIEFCNRFYGHARTCFYPNGISGKEIHLSKDEPSLNVDRTSWLDLSLGRFFAKKIQIPKNADLEYRTHMKAMVRKYEKDQFGNPIGVYVTGKEADHYAHARNYAEIALPQAMTLGASRSIAGVL